MLILLLLSLFQSPDSSAGRVYAAVFEAFYFHSDTKMFVVKANTVTGIGHVDDFDYANGLKGLQPLPEGLQADFEAKRRARGAVLPIPSRVPTRFITDSLLRTLYDLGDRFGQEFQSRFPGATSILAVSPVGFSSDGRTAMVMVDNVESTVYYLLQLDRERWSVIRRITVRET